VWDPARRRTLWIEVGVVLGLAFVPDLANAVVSWFEPPRRPELLVQTVSIMGRSLRVAPAVLFVMWRSGDGWAEFGLTRPRPVRDALLGGLTLLLAWAGAYAIVLGGGADLFGFRVVPERGRLFAGPEGVGGWLLILATAAANGFAEELAMRGFLIPRLERLWGTSLGAVAVSAGLTASYHVYGGAWHVFWAGMFGLTAGAVFVATRRLWPVAFAHLLGDVLPFLFQ
jgi:membrane protease YdiL (CAAX protease family)